MAQLPKPRPFEDKKFAREAGRLGGKASWEKRRPKELQNLGPLDEPQDAKRWLTKITESLLSGGLDPSRARAAVSALLAWRDFNREEPVSDPPPITVTILED
jgi:general stress protein YciG